jgi:PAS domain S-box-containing protein
MDGIHVVGVAITVALVVLTARNRETRGAKFVLGMVSTVTIWLAANVVIANSTTIGQMVFWGRVVYSTAPFVIMFFFLFVLEYTGYHERVTRRTASLLAVEPVAMTILVWTDDWQSLFSTGIERTQLGYWGFGFELGPAFYGHLLYTYVLIGVSVLLLARLLVVSQSLYPRQVYAVLAAVLAPSLADFLLQVGVTNVEYTPVAFVFSSVLLTMAVFRFKLLGLSPVSQSTVIENIREGLFVVDSDGDVVEMNSVARSYLGLEGVGVVGHDHETVLGDVPELRSAFGDAEEDEGTVRVSTDDGERFFHVQVTTLRDHRGEPIGRQFLLLDVTERTERERELARQNEQLDRFASVVSHDLRNPLNLASSRLELAREDDDDVHLDAVADAHRRMEDLIDDVLTLARDGQTIAATEQVQLSTVAREAWANTVSQDAELDVESDLSLEADAARLRRLFENLFRNAVQHAGPAATVSVGALPPTEDGAARGFYVEDDGPGIPPEDRERVLEDGYTTDEDGTGLGLSIVVSIADAHGWSVDVTESESGGARFEIRLPSCGTDRAATTTEASLD